jgi:hypothetical protein
MDNIGPVWIQSIFRILEECYGIVKYFVLQKIKRCLDVTDLAVLETVVLLNLSFLSFRNLSFDVIFLNCGFAWLWYSKPKLIDTVVFRNHVFTTSKRSLTWKYGNLWCLSCLAHEHNFSTFFCIQQQQQSLLVPNKLG